MIFKKLIEGYSDRDVSNSWVYNLIYRKKLGEISSLESQISNLTSQINTLNTELPNKTSDYNTNKSILEREINNKKDQITNLKNEIDDLKKKKEDLQFDITQGGVERNIKLSDLNNKNSDWIDAKNDTNNQLNANLPLKKTENVESANFYKLLESQNKEISSEIVNQKRNLTTSDRKYVISNYKIQSYNKLNVFLLFVYIIIALYVTYKIIKGMITENIYGKIIIILLIFLYPIYMFYLEMIVYDQYKLIKSMIRAEPYKPVE